MDVSASATVSYNCMYGFLDSNDDGLEDVAIRCRELTKDNHKKVHGDDSTVFFSLKGGKFIGGVVTKPDLRRKLWSDLCRSSRANKLCENIHPK